MRSILLLLVGPGFALPSTTEVDGTMHRSRHRRCLGRLLFFRWVGRFEELPAFLLLSERRNGGQQRGAAAAAAGGGGGGGGGAPSLLAVVG